MVTRPSDPEQTQPATPSGVRELPLVALRETVIFPEMIVPLQVGRDKSVNALNAAAPRNAAQTSDPACAVASPSST